MNLYEYVHTGCYGRFRLVLPWNFNARGCSVVCEKCRMLWDDVSDVQMQRPPERLRFDSISISGQSLMEIDLYRYDFDF